MKWIAGIVILFGALLVLIGFQPDNSQTGFMDNFLLIFVPIGLFFIFMGGLIAVMRREYRKDAGELG